jgi:hypothetical protein
MCSGIALAVTELPADVADDPHLVGRLYEREGRKEMRFLCWQSPRILPVQWNGRLHILPWGNRMRMRGKLPASGWITREELDSGVFAHVQAEDAVIPCHLGLHRGTWFLILEGIRGIVAKAAEGNPVAYMLMEPSSNYYRNMTEQEKLMPVLVDQVI